MRDVPGQRRVTSASKPWSWAGLGLGLFAGLSGCSDPLPSSVENYREACLRMTCNPIPTKNDDPHQGRKHVYACGISMERLASNERPFDDGVLIVKESMRDDSSYAWLVATAKKRDGRWRWDEYTRNFEGEDFLHIASGESVCIDCHKKVSDKDYIYTLHSYSDACPAP